MPLSDRMKKLLDKRRGERESESGEKDPIFFDNSTITATTDKNREKGVLMRLLPLNDAEMAHPRATMVGIQVDELYLNVGDDADDEDGETKFTIDPQTHGGKSPISKAFKAAWRRAKGEEEKKRVLSEMRDIVSQRRTVYCKVAILSGEEAGQVKILKMGIKPHTAIETHIETNEDDVADLMAGRNFYYSKKGARRETAYFASFVTTTSKVGEEIKKHNAIVKAASALNIIDHIPATDYGILREMYEALTAHESLPEGYGPPDGSPVPAKATTSPKGKSAPKVVEPDADPDGDDPDIDPDGDDPDPPPVTTPAKGKAKAAPASKGKPAAAPDPDDDLDDPSDPPAPEGDDDAPTGDDPAEVVEDLDDDEVSLEKPKYKINDTVTITVSGTEMKGVISSVEPVLPDQPIKYIVRVNGKGYKAKEDLIKPSKK